MCLHSVCLFTFSYEMNHKLINSAFAVGILNSIHRMADVQRRRFRYGKVKNK